MEKLKIGITADSSSGIEYAPFKTNVKVTRTLITLNGKEYLDGRDINDDQFYKMIQETDSVPTTSAPETGMLLSKAEEWASEGATDVIHFAISSKLSTYCEHCGPIVQGLLDSDINYHVFDSHSATLLEGLNAHYAEILANKGYSVEEIFAECRKFSDNTEAFFVVDDLKYLVKNGRLSGAAGFIGSLVKIKPVLHLTNEGEIVTYEKIRTHSKAIERMFELLVDSAKDAKKVLYVVLHTDRYDDAVLLKEKLESTVSNAHLSYLSTITPTVGAHIGAKILGIGRVILDDLKEDFE